MEMGKGKKRYVEPVLNEAIVNKIHQQNLNEKIVFNCPYIDCYDVNSHHIIL